MGLIDDATNPKPKATGLLAAYQQPHSTPPLSSFFARPEVNNLYYNGKTVVLDGYKFVGCRFDNCNLQVSSTNFDLIKCVIDSSTVVTYGSAVTRIIRLFNSRYPWAYQNLPAFVPILNSDGSITITDQPT